MLEWPMLRTFTSSLPYTETRKTLRRRREGEAVNRGLSLTLMRLVLMSLLGMGLSLTSAQATLDAYTQAKSALEASIAATPDDSVASLDALRQAKRAFTPLGESLGSSLNQGLQVTFERAEQAIINASQADLRVQGAVLFGGFQRSLYEEALTRAQEDDLAQARRLLGVLGQDLELTPAQFSGIGAEGNAARALQLTFEKRLAARSLQQLKTLRDLPETTGTRDTRYELLGQLYSHVFLIQDSPRLPSPTQTTVLDAIQALIARRTLEPSLTTLQTQLQDFQRASTAAQRQLAPLEPAQAAQTPSTATSETAQTPSEAPVETQPENEAALETPATATEVEGTTPPTAEEALPEQAATNEPPSEQLPATSASTTPPEAANEPTSTASSSPIEPPPTATPEIVDPTQVPSQPFTNSSLFGLFTNPVRTYLLSAAGLLALVGIVLLLAQAGTSPALNIATVLLLLPVLAEGLIALGTVLAPLVGLPVLAQGEQYSLFVNPLMQGVWVLLAIGAGLFLLFTRRTPISNTAVSRKELDRSDAASPQVAPAAPDLRTTPSPPQRAPVGSTGRVNWDEDF